LLTSAKVATPEEVLSVDAQWLEQFQAYRDQVQSTKLNDITDSLSRVVPSAQLSLLRYKRNALENGWRRKGGTKPHRLRPTAELEDYAILLHYHTLEDPPIYHYVSDIMNSPETRVENPDKVRAVMPFVKGIMEACLQLSRSYPELSYGPAEAYRGMRYVYDDERWANFAEGSQICWYTVKSVAATQQAVRTFLGDRGDCTIFKIENCTGTMIKEFSAYQAEDELLIMPGTYFEVVSAQRSLKSNSHSHDAFHRADIITLRVMDLD
jgi:hypothetical protein